MKPASTLWFLLIAMLTPLIWPCQPAANEDDPMRPDNHRVAQDLGSLNPNAPAELSRFAFLVGKYRCEAKIKSSTGEWQTFHATWDGRYILDGYAIEDEYRMTDPSGKLVVIGMNFRAYDPAKQKWNIQWLNGLDGTWMELGSDDLGGVKMDDHSITYAFKETVAFQAYVRATYTVISKTHFTWRGERSDDGKSWSEFMVIEANRVDE